MRESAIVAEPAVAPKISPVTYVAIAAMLLIMALSAVTFVATSSNDAASPAYDPATSLIGFSPDE